MNERRENPPQETIDAMEKDVAWTKKTVVEFIVQMRRVWLLGLVIIVALVGLGSWFIGQNSDRISDSVKAIKVSCTLLANAITESGGAAQGNPASPQARLQLLYVTALARNMTAAEQAQARELQKQVGGSSLSIPPCEDIARHPDSVTARAVGTATVP